MAGQDLEKLVVSLSADIKKFENAMNRAAGITNQRMGKIQKKATESSAAIAASVAKSGASLAAGLVTAEAVRKMVEFSEAATRIDNALKVAGLSGDRLETVYAKLSSAAKANGAPIESLVDLYGKVSLVQKELNVSSDELIGFSGNVALALRVAGTDAQAASGALMQLAQALGGGVVRAEEFNSILEGAPTIAQAAAAGLKEAGGSVSKLRNLMLDGQISSEAFFRAFEAGAPILEDRAKAATLTLAQAQTNLSTALIDVAREFNTTTGASKNFASGIDAAARAVSSFDVSGFLQKVQEAKNSLVGFLNDLGNADIFKSLNEAMGVTEGGLIVNINKTEAENEAAALEREIQLLQETISKNTSLGFDNTEALSRLDEVKAKLSEIRAVASGMPETVQSINVDGSVDTGSTNGQMGGSSSRGGKRNAVVKPVSIKTFAVKEDGSGGKSVGRSKQPRKNEYERELAQIQQRTAALQAETAAQAGLNPLVNDYGFAVEYARAKQDLLTAAQQAGVKITPELEANIDKLATAYGNAVVESEKLTESQDRIRQAADDFKNTAKDVTAGFISDLRDGKSAAEALAGALQKVGDKLLDIALNDLFGLGGSSGGGVFGGIFKALGFANGGFTGSGNKYDPAGIVHKGEYVVPKAVVDKIGVRNIEKLMGGYANGGLVGLKAPRLPDISGAVRASTAVNVTYAPKNDMRGASVEAVARLQQAMAQDRADLEARVVSAIRTAKSRGARGL